MRVGVIGASGYAGSEVVRLVLTHPEMTLAGIAASSNAGRDLVEIVPALGRLGRGLALEDVESVVEGDLDLVFVALPHGASQEPVARLVERGVAVVDLGADFRLRDASDYPRWYHDEHRRPELLGEAVYGLVERHREELPGARLIAAPGCYPTASILALAPFVDRGVVAREQIVVNALSGSSGAGRAPSERLHHPRLSSNAEAYGLLDHRHTAEIEQELGATALFTPHLVPTSRGMLVSAYARLTDSLSTDDALEILAASYANDPCVVVVEQPPTLKDPVGSNLCFVSARADERTGWLVAMSSIDNLLKGAAGQAVQAANVAFGWDETSGLPLTGVTP